MKKNLVVANPSALSSGLIKYAVANAEFLSSRDDWPGVHWLRRVEMQLKNNQMCSPYELLFSFNWGNMGDLRALKFLVPIIRRRVSKPLAFSSLLYEHNPQTSKHGDN